MIVAAVVAAAVIAAVVTPVVAATMMAAATLIGVAAGGAAMVMGRGLGEGRDREGGGERRGNERDTFHDRPTRETRVRLTSWSDRTTRDPGRGVSCRPMYKKILLAYDGSETGQSAAASQSSGPAG